MSEPKLDKFGEPYYIWLQLYGDGSREDGPVPYDADGVTWCWHQIHSSDLKYIRAGVKHTNQIAEIASLRAQHTEQAAEIAALRKDAERFRFVITLGRLPTQTVSGYHYLDGVFYPTPQAAIDAALASSAR